MSELASLIENNQRRLAVTQVKLHLPTIVRETILRSLSCSTHCQQVADVINYTRYCGEISCGILMEEIAVEFGLSPNQLTNALGYLSGIRVEVDFPVGADTYSFNVAVHKNYFSRGKLKPICLLLTLRN